MWHLISLYKRKKALPTAKVSNAFLEFIKIIVLASRLERTINAFFILLSFCYQIKVFHTRKPMFMRVFRLSDLFPLNSRRRFSSYIINNSVYVANFINYPACTGLQNLVRYLCKISSHKVGRGNSP